MKAFHIYGLTALLLLAGPSSAETLFSNGFGFKNSYYPPQPVFVQGKASRKFPFDP